MREELFTEPLFYGFRVNGVYIHMNDKKKEGYFTQSNDGMLKKHKYGFWDKFYEIRKYGRTHDVSYKYIFFYKNLFQVQSIDLYIGSLDGELTEILSSFKNFSSLGMQCHKQQYIVAQHQLIRYNDKKNRSCKITAQNNALQLMLENYSFYNDVVKISKFQFYHLG